MAGLTTAGVEFSGSVMRYAEIEQAESRFRLQRLGNCEFEFDAASVAYLGMQPDLLPTIREAIQDVFRDTTSSVIRFVIPTPLQTRFSTAVPIDADVQERSGLIGFETRLFTSNREGGDVFPVHLRSENRSQVQGFAVAHVDERVANHIRAVGSVFPDVEVQMVPSMNAAALSFRHVAHRESLSTGSYLLVGMIDGRSDFILMHNAESLTHSTMVTPYPEDTAYHALLTCSRFGKTCHDIQTVYVYGNADREAGMAGLRDAFGDRVQLLNPGIIVNLEPDRFETDYPIEAFVPAIGAAIQ
ncbi:MAG: hypothetical protein O2797_05825 [Bacteroidetes bacterium]|nr:hypothetical protein [Bacteroidota bacterium]MDA1333721.1 hypothetical protein [Bacteroidota bacterium]